jgi:hypothetical protein
MSINLKCMKEIKDPKIKSCTLPQPTNEGLGQGYLSKYNTLYYITT